ncbi:MAG TPA: S9 family peptidase, partial [Actinomycetota bacterium]|nr:S9 family peptidase [Actinomycetota bacterium]
RHSAHRVGDRERLESVLALLDRVRYPVDLSFTHRGDALAVAVFPAHLERAGSYQSRIWRVPLDGGAPEQLTTGPRTDALPAWSPIDDRLAFAAERPIVGRMSPFLLEPGGEPRLIGDVDGSVQALAWSLDGTSVFALAVDEGGFGAATDGAIRLRWSDAPDPAVFRPDTGWRRLLRIDVETGKTEEVGPHGVSVWEFDLVDASKAVALVSEDPSESGWYRARLALLDLERRTFRDLWIPDRQVQGPALDPTRSRVAVLEGWSSDRGLVAGDVRMIELESGEVQPFDSDLSDLSSIGWLDTERLWFAGWEGFGSRFGVVGAAGKVEWASTDDAIVGPNSFHARVAPIPSGGFVAIRESLRDPPEVMRRDDGTDATWTPLTSFNDGVRADLRWYPEVRELEWHGAGGLPIRGLLMLPDGDPPFRTVVMIHGGPTWACKHGFDPGYSLPLAAAGFAVFLPNYRGSTGRGQAFTRLNVGDPAGDEFEDILLGVEHCVSLGVTMPDAVGVTGGSYGGYLTGWAVCTTDRFAAGVMVSGIVDHLSTHLTCNHAFSEFIFEGDHRDPEKLGLFMERSPITHVANAKTPTLILHGSEDQCTPLGQAEELYQALVVNGTPTELVVYPREGHGFREREHAADAQRRTVGWFERHLEGRG